MEITIKIILHKLPGLKKNQHENRQKSRCGDYYHFEFDVVVVAAAVDPHEDGVAGPGREPQRQRVADVVRPLARRVGEGHQANTRPKLVQGTHWKHTGKDGSEYLMTHSTHFIYSYMGEGHQANTWPKLVQGAHCKHTGKDGSEYLMMHSTHFIYSYMTDICMVRKILFNDTQVTCRWVRSERSCHNHIISDR